MASLEERFNAVVEAVRTEKPAKEASSSDKLSIYALFKQAKEGDVKGERPGMFSMEARAKYDAWSKNKGMDTNTAMENYIAEYERQAKLYASAA